QNVKPLRLVVDGRYREYIERLNEADFLRSIGAADVLESVAERLGLPAKFFEILLVPLSQVAADTQTRLRMPRMQQAERIDELMQPLFRADAGKVADRERRTVAFARQSVMSGEIDSEREQIKLFEG